MEEVGEFVDESPFLKARVIQDQGDRFVQGQRAQAPQQLTHTLGIDIGFVGDGNQFMGDRVQRPQDLESLSTRFGRQEQPGKGPEKPQ